jgi:hypothetical protein
MMTKRPKTGGDLVTGGWSLYFTAQLIASVFAGPMSDRGLIREIFWLAVPMSAQVVIPVWCGCFPERKLPLNKRGTVPLIFKQDFALKGAIGSHVARVGASIHVFQ